MDVNKLGLYLLRTVRVTLDGGEVRTGKLMNILLSEEKIQIEEAYYGLSQIRDVEFVGKISDFHTYRGFGEVEGIPFSLEDLGEGLSPKSILYGEFECIVTCHLELAGTKIGAKDLKLVARTHRIYEQELKNSDYWYRLNDGTVYTGRLTADSPLRLLQTNGNERELDLGEVADITKAPSVNDYVDTELKDGRRIAGVVSAVTDSMLVLIGDAVSMVGIGDIRILRYRGRVVLGTAMTGKGTIRKVRVSIDGRENGILLCKKPFFRDGEKYDKLSGGELVSFLVGVTNKGIIAKDVELEETEASGTSDKDEGVFEGKGVLLFLPSGNNGETMGYIGREYVSKAYSRLAGCEMPKGAISFVREQIGFDCEPGNVYVVRYKCAGDPAVSVQKALSVELEEILPFGECARIEVKETGEIEVLPFSVAYLSSFEHSDIELSLKSGQVVNGYLADCRESEITVLNNDEPDLSKEIYEKRDIMKARFYGVVTSYRSENGTGYLNGEYWFHINNLRDFRDASKIKKGSRVIFAIEQTNKGKLCAANDITVIVEGVERGMLVGYDGVLCRIVSQEAYHQSGETKEYPLIAARGTIEEKLGELSLNAFDYPIAYSLRKSGLETGVVISHIDLANKALKPLEGYVLKFVNKPKGVSFGFILEPEQLQKHLKNNDRTGTVYFRLSDVVNASRFEINTYNKYYHVSYLLNENKTARNVRILSEHEFPGKAPAAPVQPTEPVVGTTVPESIDLGQYAFSKEIYYQDAETRFGLVNICSSHYALINTQYINKMLLQDESYKGAGLAVIFDPSQTKFVGDSNMKTGKFSYLVRYVAKGTVVNTKTGAEHPAIDYDYPVEILQAIAKKICLRISIEEGRVNIEKATQESAASGIPAPKSDPQSAPPQTFDMPELAVGESVIFQMPDKSQSCYTYIGEDADCFIVDDDIRILKDSVARICRFGIVTAFDMEKGIATLNRLLDVPLSAVDQKVINILKSQLNGVRLHVMYTCENDQVVAVNRITEEYSRLFKWIEGTVSGCDTAKKLLTIDEKVNHYISVLSDGMISRTYKANTIIGKTVYSKVVNHLIFLEESNEIAIVSSAIEVRLKKETATVQYDAGLDSYKGYRNPTFFYPIYGSPVALGKYVDLEIEVTFFPANDGYDLEARYGDEDMEDAIDEAAEEIENSALENVMEEGLVSFCMKQVDLGQLLLKGVLLDDEGMPRDYEQAQKAFGILRGQPGDAALIAATVIAARFPEITIDKNKNDSYDAERNSQIARMMISGIQKRSRKVGMDANCVSGEHAYYISLLLRYPLRRGGRRFGSQFSFNDCLFQLFMQDFGTREELGNYLQRGIQADRRQLYGLLARKCKQTKELMVHLILLDQKSLEIICNNLENQDQLAQEIRRIASQIDESAKSMSLLDTMQSIREKYRRDKSRFTARLKLLLEGTEIAAELRSLLVDIQARFVKMMCDDDADRFERLLKACSSICEYVNCPGFSRQEDALKSAYREICEIEEEIRQHPCKESVEILFMMADATTGQNAFCRLRSEVGCLLNALYQDAASIPQIVCVPNEVTLDENQTSFWLIVRNGRSDMKLQPADNVVIHLESYTEGISVARQIEVKHLAAGDQKPQEAALVADTSNREAVTIGWSVEFDCAVSFTDGMTLKERKVVDQGDYFELQFGANNAMDKNVAYENPYSDPAQGQPLEDGKMFYGRVAESKEIRDSIIRNTDGKESFIDGSAVIIHGQKKSGKTSLVYQIKNYIKSAPALNRTAIILNFNNILDEMGGVELLSCFKRTFYANILSRFEDEIYGNHLDVVELLDDNHLEIPDLFDPANREIWAAQFDRFFRDFFRVDHSRHTIVLFMDEFTLLCTTIMGEIDRNPDNRALATIPNFIKTFSMYGFVQVIIGHEAMMRAFDQLGVLNHTAEFAKSIEIAALDYEASVKLIAEPMEKTFGFNPYSTELGNRAVERLLDLSGRNPTYLMRLCNKMCDYYLSDACTHSQLLVGDVEVMLDGFVDELLLTDFDILLVEDGDDAEDPEKRKTYQFLKCAAFLSVDSYDGRTADNNQISRQLGEEYGWSDEKIEKTRNLLEARRVISITSGGRVKINTGLFVEFMLRKNGR